MKLIIAEDYTELSRIAADIVENQVLLKPDSCLGTVTGGSPAGMYLELVRRSREEGLDLSEISVINTDEYAGLSGNHPQSYRYYLEHRFLDPCKIPGERAAVPRGTQGIWSRNAAAMRHSAGAIRRICRSSAWAIRAISALMSRRIIFRRGLISYRWPRRPWRPTRRILKAGNRCRRRP